MSNYFDYYSVDATTSNTSNSGYASTIHYTINPTTGTSSTSNYTAYTAAPGPRLTQWNNQVFFEPSQKLQTLFRALQLI